MRWNGFTQGLLVAFWVMRPEWWGGSTMFKDRARLSLQVVMYQVTAPHSNKPSLELTNKAHQHKPLVYGWRSHHRLSFINWFYCCMNCMNDMNTYGFIVHTSYLGVNNYMHEWFQTTSRLQKCFQITKPSLLCKCNKKKSTLCSGKVLNCWPCIIVTQVGNAIR